MASVAVAVAGCRSLATYPQVDSKWFYTELTETHATIDMTIPVGLKSTPAKSRKLLTASLLIALGATSGCSSPPKREPLKAPTAAEKNEIGKAAAVCAIRSAAALDDGVSPANVVGRAVGRACDRAFTAYFVSRADGDENVLLAMIPHLEAFKQDLGTDTVLSGRADRGKPQRR